MKFALKLGDGKIEAVVHQHKSAAPTMLNVHDDEDTSVAAGKANIAEFGGRLIELTHSGERLITFSINDDKYAFDPNRIFSDIGITETLKKHSTNSPTAHAAIKSFAAEYLKQFALDKESVIIALHNTVDGIFSAESFLKTGYLGSDASDVHINKKRSKFDFFYVTERKFFDFLKRRDFNAVMQDHASVTEDGSLSVHFSKRGIPYVNVEAEMRHLDEQIEMLKVTREMIAGVKN